MRLKFLLSEFICIISEKYASIEFSQCHYTVTSYRKFLNFIVHITYYNYSSTISSISVIQVTSDVTMI